MSGPDTAILVVADSVDLRDALRVPVVTALDLVAAQDAMLKQSAEREARLRAALVAVRDTHESSRKAASKGARQYGAAFLWACYGREVEEALS